MHHSGSAMAADTQFDCTTALTPTDQPDVFGATLDESWASLRGVHGVGT